MAELASAASIPPWHEPALAQLASALDGDRLAHSVIVSGPPGWGQLTLACRLAAGLLEQPAERVHAEFAHVDFRWVKRELNTSGSKLSEVIKVDQIRDIQTFLHTSGSAGRRKVLVIDEAHRLNEQAANALLKTLEEPAPGTHILLVTEAAGRLLPTVRSRCQVWPAVPVPADVVRAWLLAQGVDESSVDGLLFEYGGAPEPALAAAMDDETPLEPVLVALRRGSTVASVVDAMKDAPLDRLTARWGRYVRASAAGEGVFGELAREPVLAFSDELQSTRRHVLTNNAPNQRLILERLCHLWRQIPAV